MKRDRVAVVAGGTAGVGRATARLLAEEGWAVAVLARGEGRLRETEEELREFAPAAKAYVCDVSEAAAVERTARAIETDLGPIDVWVNAAMLTAFSRFPDMPAEEFEKIVATTFIGAVNGVRAALNAMRSRGEGRIVNVGSGLAYRAVPLQSAYCASKHGLAGFTSALRSELIAEKSDITVSMVQLPAVNTPQFDWARNRMEARPRPAPPVYAPDAAAEAVLRAARTGVRELYVGQSVLKLVFGEIIAPGWLDRKLARDGVAMQKSDTPEPGGRDDNIDGPAQRDVAADGRFDDEARRSALVVNADYVRAASVGAVCLLSATVGGVVALAL